MATLTAAGAQCSELDAKFLELRRDRAFGVNAFKKVAPVEVQ